jgi:diaminopimelate decarboxylase
VPQSQTPSPRPFYHPHPGSALHCGSVSLEALARRYGTPLYVYSADQIAERLSLFQSALAGRDHLVCYAVKSNSALAILKLLADSGAGFDIVSGGELERVLAAAPEAVGRVVFSGVGKTAPEIDLALKAGILEFNVESEAELALLAARARKLKRTATYSPTPIPTFPPACASTSSASISARRCASTRAQPGIAGSRRTELAFTSARKFAPRNRLAKPWSA